jgi:lysophospholipase L1-like esterase
MMNILVFGDSIAFGDYDKEGGWVDRLKRHFITKAVNQELKQDINIYNLSTPRGDTTKDILTRLTNEIPPRHWKHHETVLIFAIGINDSIIEKGENWVSKTKFRSNLKRIIKISRNYSNKIFFLSPTPVEEEKVTPMPWSPNESYFNKEIKQYVKIMEEVCKTHKINYLSLFDYFINLNYKSLLFDGAHPNTKGHKLIFEIVKDFLKKKKLIE